MTLISLSRIREESTGSALYTCISYMGNGSVARGTN